MNECDQELFPAWLPPYLILDPPPVLVVIDICRCVCVVFRWMSLQYWQAAAEKTANVLQKSCRLKNEKLHGDLISSSYHHRYAIGYMWNKLLQNYFSLRRRPSPTEIILFQRVETCLKLFQNYFTGLLRLLNIFQHVQCRWNNFEIILKLFQRLK